MPESRTPKKQYLSFGLNSALPDSYVAAWGARWIFPDDLVSDRQSFVGYDTPEGARLDKWLCGNAITHARSSARLLASLGKVSSNSKVTVVLYEDSVGSIKGNPQGSYGYLYVCAYLKELPDA